MNITIRNMSSRPVKSNGYLELIIGPMYSGKTSKLLEIYKQCKFCDIPVCVINHSFDKRYHDSMLSSHDKIMIPCLNTDDLYELWFTENLNHNLVKQSDVILINEGQFFNKLHFIVSDMLKNNKAVYICGLDGDFERKKFGQILCDTRHAHTHRCPELRYVRAYACTCMHCMHCKHSNCSTLRSIPPSVSIIGRNWPPMFISNA